MIKFTEAVKQYSEAKKARGLSPIVNSKEIAKIRQFYKEGKFNETEDCDDEKEEKKELTESQKILYKKELAKLRDYKESKGMGRGLTTKQKKMLEQTILMGTLGKPQYLKDNAKNVLAGTLKVENTSKKDEKLTEATDIKSKIREARRNVFKAKIALRENDMLGAADATQAAGDAVNAADAAVPAAEGAVPQNIVDAISNIKTSVDQLATQCGIESPVDFGGDPNAGVPAVDGTMQDPNAGAAPAQQPVMESTDKISAAKARLAKREAMLSKVKEGTDGQDAITQAINAMTNPQQFHDIDKKDSEELVKPTTAKSKDAANTWPTVKGTYKESITEKMISDRIKENEDNWNWNKILKEGILG